MNEKFQGRKSRRDVDSDEDDSDDEYAKFARMKQKMVEKGKISASESDDDNDEFAEFMRWKKQKRKAQRRGIDDWDHDTWADAAPRPVNRTSSGYSSASSGMARNVVQGRV